MNPNLPYLIQDRTTLRRLLTQHLRAPETTFWKNRLDAFSGYFRNRYGAEEYDRVAATIKDREHLRVTCS